VDARVRDEVRLELRHVDVEGTVEAEGRRQGRDDLRDEAVQVRVRRALDVEVAAADVVDGLVVEDDGDVRVLEERVRRQDGVVRLNDGRGDLRRRVDREAELGLLAVVDGQALQEERAEAGACATTDGVEHEEALQARAVVRELADAVEAEVDDLLADRVVAAREVVGGVLLAGDELLRVEQLAVVPVRTSSITVGSRSRNTERGTCLPAPVSEKNVLNASSPPPIVLSDGIWPSGWMPCSRQNSSQQALPTWIPP